MLAKSHNQHCLLIRLTSGSKMLFTCLFVHIYWNANLMAVNPYALLQNEAKTFDSCFTYPSIDCCLTKSSAKFEIINIGVVPVLGTTLHSRQRKMIKYAPGDTDLCV